VPHTALSHIFIDILIAFEPGKKTFDNYIDLEFYLEELLNKRR